MFRLVFRGGNFQVHCLFLLQSNAESENLKVIMIHQPTCRSFPRFPLEIFNLESSRLPSYCLLLLPLWRQRYSQGYRDWHMGPFEWY